MPDIAANIAALREKMGSTQLGGKGSVRRKAKATHKSSGADDKKLLTALGRISTNNIPGVEEVNMNKSNGEAIIFKNPKHVFANTGSKMWVVSGPNKVGPATGGFPTGGAPDFESLLRSLGPDAMEKLKAQLGGLGAGGVGGDDEMPELEADFESAAK